MSMSGEGKLCLVSVGPGFADLIIPRAERALRASEVVVGYELYFEWIKPWLVGKEIFSIPLTKERERATVSLDLARRGKFVSLVSSGDIGVYAMAALVLEEMHETDTFALEVIPGVSAANSCASLLGSPLSHDFATLSLSDLLCPWEWITNRARHLAQADMAVALYNVQSRQRQSGIYEVLKIFLEHKSPDSLCGVVKNAYREGEEKSICTLSELLNRQFDMLTTIIIGNRFTRRKKQYIYTPRGYNSWGPEKPEEPIEDLTKKPSVWVFSGTGDGNALAAGLVKEGWNVIVSVATEYGREVLESKYPGLTVCVGRMGVEARRVELQRSRACWIVDATHPFASEISTQLIQLSKEIGIPYIRYERPPSKKIDSAIYCHDMSQAAKQALQKGKRIFLGTGTKDLVTFVEAPSEPSVQWFVRMTPDSSSLAEALRLAIPRENICAMQGPFTHEFNEALWRNWKIDCIVTKESGEAGGYLAKVEAAKSLDIPLIVVQRPSIDYPCIVNDYDAIIGFLNKIRNNS